MDLFEKVKNCIEERSKQAKILSSLQSEMVFVDYGEPVELFEYGQPILPFPPLRKGKKSVRVYLIMMNYWYNTDQVIVYLNSIGLRPAVAQELAELTIFSRRPSFIVSLGSPRPNTNGVLQVLQMSVFKNERLLGVETFDKQWNSYIGFAAVKK